MHLFEPLSFVRRNRALRAFGLTELLVVLLILSVLALLSLPVGQRIRGKAKQVGCISHLKQIHAGLVAHAADHHGFFPKAHDIRGVGEDRVVSLWIAKLWSEGYIANGSGKTKTPGQFINFCPGSTVVNDTKGNRSTTGHYAINRSIAGFYSEGANSDGTDRDDETIPLARINQPSSKVLVFDYGNTYASRANTRLANPNRPNYIPGLRLNRDFEFDYRCKRDAHEGRHGRTINVIMVDGHVETFSPEDFRELPEEAWLP